MAPRNAIETFTPWFERAFAELMPDEDLLWGLGMITLVDPKPLGEKPTGTPEQQVNANPYVTSVVLHIEAPGAPGTHLATDVLMNMSTITEEHARQTVGDLARKLPVQRAAQQEALEQSKAGRAPTSGRLTL